MLAEEYGRSLFILILVLATIVVAIILHASPVPPQGRTANGTLAGNVTIGPLCPVEPCHPAPGQLAAAYAARTIVVTGPGGFIAEAVPDPVNGYRFSLPPGTYTVGIRQQGMDRGAGLPASVIIPANGTVRLDISIDTGIR